MYTCLYVFLRVYTHAYLIICCKLCTWIHIYCLLLHVHACKQICVYVYGAYILFC